MAKYEIFEGVSLSPGGFFPVGIEIDPVDNGSNGRDYPFTIDGEVRFVRIHWGDNFLIDTIQLFGADNALLAGISGVSMNVDDFEELWFETAVTSTQVFTTIFSLDDEVIGNEGENIFLPGLGNDTIYGGNNSPEFFDYVDYSADNREHGITVDLVDGDADDDIGKVTSRGGPAETDILHSINGIYATAHDDLLIGDNRDNEFYAGFGNDTIHGGGGPNGNLDVLSYRPDGRAQGITVTFTAQGVGKVTSDEKGGEQDIFTGVEAVYGTAQADRFTGAAGFQRFRGFAGNDTFDGGADDDEVDYRSDTTEVPGGVGIIVDLSNVDGEGRVTVEGANRDVDTLISIEQIRGTRNNDAIAGTNANNRLRGDAGDDELNGRGGDDRLEGGNGNDTVLGGAGNDMLYGDAGNDTLNGGAGWDTLDGGAGNDLLIGGIGEPEDEDVFIGGTGNDTIYGGDVEEADDGTVNWNEINYNVGAFSGIVVKFAASDGRYGVGTVVKKGGDGEIIGTDHFYDINLIRGTMGADSFEGADDAITQRFIGYGGNDTFDGSNGINEIDYRADARAAGLTSGMIIDLGTGKVTDATGDEDTLISIENIRGTESNDQISGNGLHNRLRGDAGNDTLRGKDGNDTLDGGAGFDTLDGGDGNDLLIGDTGNDTLNGDAGNDTLDGGVGNDTLEGGADNDDISGGDGSDTLKGDAGNDTLDGGVGNDTLDGGSGNDLLIGGIGGAGEEDWFEGSKGDDTIHGGLEGEDDDPNQNHWNEISYYKKGISGIEVTFGSTSRSGTVRKLGDAGTDTFTSIDAVRGTEEADKFIGGDSAGVQRFIGYEGNDTFDGSLGVNEIDYRAEARAAQSTSGVNVDLSTGIATYRGFTDTLRAIERIRGTENADTISGDSMSNLLRGDAGNDTLMGRGGNDTLNGGAGGDTAIFSAGRSSYHVIHSGTELTIVDQRGGGDGTDTVIDVEFFNFNGTLLNVAEVINHGSAVNLTGGMVFENSKVGETVGTLSVANPDALSVHGFELVNDAGGRFQIDSSGKITVKNGLLLDYEQATTHTIAVRAKDQFGKVVDQTLTVVLKDVDKESTTGTAGGDTVSGGANADTLAGGGGNDVLNAGGGKDKVDGGTGNDRIIGGGGQDTLTGGAGKDVFAFGTKDTGTSKGTADYITDFSGRGGDKIDLKAIDADVKKQGDQAFSFIGKNAFTKAGQVRYEKTSKETFIYLNTDSDKAAEGVIKLKGAMDLQKAWFVL
ncbi:hypothetical protein [Microvirga zambiensis]|uniref:hypothetical protein n=1 Tax=Microvirga zambiensis TaxID=1402137 RepID=UPI00191D716B|nr:hypothetical protein [Microvirga zambiensis]